METPFPSDTTESASEPEQSDEIIPSTGEQVPPPGNKLPLIAAGGAALLGLVLFATAFVDGGYLQSMLPSSSESPAPTYSPLASPGSSESPLSSPSPLVTPSAECECPYGNFENIDPDSGEAEEPFSCDAIVPEAGIESKTCELNEETWACEMETIPLFPNVDCFTDEDRLEGAAVSMCAEDYDIYAPDRAACEARTVPYEVITDIDCESVGLGDRPASPGVDDIRNATITCWGITGETEEREISCAANPLPSDAPEPPTIESEGNCQDPSLLACSDGQCRLKITCPDDSVEYYPSAAGISCASPSPTPSPSEEPVVGTPSPSSFPTSSSYPVYTTPTTSF